MIIPFYQAAILHAKAYRLLRQDVASFLKPFDLSMQEWVVLSLLFHKESQNSSELATELAVEMPMITQLTTVLEEKKHIQREVSKEDKRQRLFSLTSEGRVFVQRCEQHLKDALLSYFDGVSFDDVHGHLNVLSKIIEKHQEE